MIYAKKQSIIKAVDQFEKKKVMPEACFTQLSQETGKGRGFCIDGQTTLVYCPMINRAEPVGLEYIQADWQLSAPPA
ncbi:MAG: hypothetical protein ACU83N_10435 [Gammaproteobacteria bacterium]